ncbi:MAG: family 10 glycosylhydrolase [Anaerolineae bacterium]|nr:family 10 glycosylhydrolase [Anaerolineae bacterium]
MAFTSNHWLRVASLALAALLPLFALGGAASMTQAQERSPAPPAPKVTVEKPVYMPLVQRDEAKADPRQEVRALWVSRFDLGSPPSKQERLEALIDRAADAGFNVILLQVRATGDAYYTPGAEPWTYRLTSSNISDLGRDPGWDPLAVAVRTAHARGIELHAYLNAFTAWECSRGAPPHIQPEHAYWALANYDPATKAYDPAWRVHARIEGTPTPMGDAKTDPVACSEYLWASPGVSRVHERNLAVMRDILTRYDVDGIHLDRVRYPGRQYSHDPESLEAWRATAPAVSFENWQRDNLSRWIARYQSEIKALKPAATLSAAVWFTYKKTAAMTFPTSQGYFDYYQDSHRWLTEGSMDAIAPMIYGTTFNADIEKWKVLAADHVAAQEATQGKGQVWLGLGADFDDFGQVTARIDYARSLGAAGVAVWSAGAVDSRGYWDEFRAGPFK